MALRALDKQVTVTITPELRDLAVEIGFSPRFGARPLRRAIQRLVEDPLAEALLAGFAKPGTVVVVDVAPDGEEGARPPAQPMPMLIASQADDTRSEAATCRAAQL